MVRQYETPFRRLFRPAAIAQRIIVKMSHLRQPAPMAQFSRRAQVSILRRLLLRGILPGGPIWLLRFVRTMTAASAAAWPQAITDWIAGLAMRDYVRRHFGADPIRAESLVNKTADWLCQRYATSLREGILRVTAAFEQGRAELKLILCGHVELITSDRAVRRLERILRCSATTLSLRIEELRAEQHDQVRTLLRPLEPYGQRVLIWVHEGLRQLLPVDSSTFHVILDAPGG